MFSPAPSPSPASPPLSSYIDPSGTSSSSEEPDYDSSSMSRYLPFLLLIVALIFFLIEGANPNPFDEHRRLIREHHRMMRRRERLEQQRREQPPSPPPGEFGSIVCTYRVDKSAAAAAANGGEGSDCAICLEDFKVGDECQLFLSCNHGFHKACIDQWLALERHCPLCRGSVRTLPVANLDRV